MQTDEYHSPFPVGCKRHPQVGPGLCGAHQVSFLFPLNHSPSLSSLSLSFARALSLSVYVMLPKLLCNSDTRTSARFSYTTQCRYTHALQSANPTPHHADTLVWTGMTWLMVGQSTSPGPHNNLLFYPFLSFSGTVLEPEANSNYNFSAEDLPTSLLLPN
jgi:hypothetical protein